MRHPKTKHVYIGEVLDIYTQASGNRYGSVIDAAVNGASGLSAFRCGYIVPWLWTLYVT